MYLRTEVSEIEGWTVVTVHGEIDVATSPALRERLIGLVNDGSAQLVLDLEAVDFLDSTGLGTIVSILKRTRSHGGDLRLVCTEARIRRLFEITGLDSAVPLHASLDDAIGGG
ncbi:MAG TPA: STAS domain-containing protein [Acidimicrobiales bacterium]|nr:STAS domain-containing protein [Acidimicrobiales bacterium]